MTWELFQTACKNSYSDVVKQRSGIYEQPTDVAQGPQVPGRPSLSPARRRVLQAVSRLEKERTVTVPAVSAVVGGHPNTSRQLLDALCDDGYLEVSTTPADRPGRPARAYQLTTEGRRAAIDPDTEQRELLDVVFSYLGSECRPDEAHRLGHFWGRTSSRPTGVSSDADPMAVLQELFEALGFEPARSASSDDMQDNEIGDEDGDLLLRACPLLRVAPRHQDFVCALHAGFVEGILERLSADYDGDLCPFSDPGACRVRRGGEAVGPARNP